jgi:DHA2 family multidrug resistance protein-like MFS transporter
VLLELFWWGSAFLLALPVMAVLLVVGPRVLPEYKAPDAGRLDLRSAALSVTAVLAVVYGVKQIAQDGLGLPPVLAILGGLAVGVAFVARQRALADPMVDLGLFRIRAFDAALATNFLAIFVAVGYFLFVAQYLQLVAGLSPLRAGLWSLPSAFGFIVGSQVGPRVLHDVRPARVIAGGLALAAAGLGLLTQVGVTAGLAPLVIGSVVISLGLAPVFALTTELIVGAAPPEHAGAASGISETAAELGGALGIAAMGSIGVAIYRSRLADQLPAGLPAEVAAAARDTLGSAVAAAAQLPDQLGGAVVQAARDAFVAGMQRSSLIGAVVAVGVAVMALVALRDRPAAPSRTDADEELASVSASGDGWPHDPEG